MRRILAVAVLAGAATAAAAAGDAGRAAAQEGGPEVRSAWARASAGRAVNGAAYLVIVNPGARADRLVGASSGVSGRAEIHAHVDDGGVMRMKRLDGLDLPAGGTVRLAPGGRHVMLLGLRRPLRAGDSFALELSFASGVRKRVEVEVRPIGAPGPAHRRR